MKKIGTGIILLWCFFSSCGNKDAQLKADISSKAKTEINFAGVDYTVRQGVAELTGVCPTEDARKKVEEKVKKIAGIKEVRNNIVVGSLLLNADLLLKQTVNDKIKSYPDVQALVQDSVIEVSGVVKQGDKDKILKDLSSLHPRAVEDRLVSR
jgi:hypothetical protein